MLEVRKTSEFDRTQYNERNQGAYFTDPYHVQLLSNLFEFPEEDEVCCLDPCIGDGNALAIATQRSNRPNLRNFGVEINHERYSAAKKNPCIDYVLLGDFTNEVKISNKVFSFCFCNPPYMMSQFNKDRMEKVFLRKLDNYLCTGAVLCLIVPLQLFDEDEGFLKVLLNRYKIRGIFRFREPEYSKFKQIAIIAEKRQKADGWDLEYYNKVSRYLGNPDAMLLVPDNVTKKISVLPSSLSNIACFESQNVDITDFSEMRSKLNLPSVVAREAEIRDIGELGIPPVMPGQDHQYLLTVCGFGSGLVGAEEDGDIHLQRGTIVTKTDIKTVEQTDGGVLQIERKYKKVKFYVLQSSGVITSLGD